MDGGTFGIIEGHLLKRRLGVEERAYDRERMCGLVVLDVPRVWVRRCPHEHRADNIRGPLVLFMAFGRDVVIGPSTLRLRHGIPNDFLFLYKCLDRNESSIRHARL